MRSLLLALAAVLSASAAWAQVRSVGPAFLINTFTTDDQGSDSVACDSRGNFVVAWQSRGEDGSGYGIFGRRYDSTGAPRGPEFQANTYTTGNQWRRASVASDAAGNHTVVWGSDVGGQGYDFEVKGQRYDGSGNRLGGEFQVNSTTTGRQYQPSIASDAKGNVVVVWDTFSTLSNSPNAVSGQRYDAAGLPVGTEFRIDSDPTVVVKQSGVGAHDAGGFVVAWRSANYGYPPDPRHDGLFARSYDSGGAAGEEFQVSSCYAGHMRGRPAVASLGAGKFVVAWNGSYGIQAQVFDANGFVAGREIAVGWANDHPGVALVADGADRFVVLWTSGGEAVGRAFNTAGIPISVQFQVAPNNTYSIGGAALQAPGTFVVTWTAQDAPDHESSVWGRRIGGLGSELAQRDLRLDPAGNRVFENGETASVVPGWQNPTAAAIDVSGTLTGFYGHPTGIYTILDRTARYGVIAPGQRGDCTATADCYAVEVSAPARPSQHWDAMAEETLSTGTRRTWALHLGDSFADVPRTRKDYPFVEALLHHGVITGCAADRYCPDDPVSRADMAVFLRMAREGIWACSPMSCEGIFADVPQTNSFCPWIEELARYAVVTGCGDGNYCPDAPVTREQMAAFVLATREGPAYTPPDCVAGSERFADVPASSGFCRWVEELARRKVVTGCGGDLYCPGAPVTRGDMSVLVSVTFGLPLYGP